MQSDLSVRLRVALDDGLRKRQDFVERKRQQLLEFMRLSPIGSGTASGLA